MTLIQLSQVNIYRGKRELLSAVDLTVKCGELVALIGANGVGKSTLLETTTGDVPLEQGEITLFGQTLSYWSKIELAKRRAVMRQSTRLELPFSVGEVVLMGRSPYIRSHETADDLSICQHALKLVGLEGFHQRLYPQLSGGEQRRVQLARAFVQVWSEIN